MAASFSLFHCPPAKPKELSFIPHNGPPQRKSFVRQSSRKGSSSVAHEQFDVDKLSEVNQGSNPSLKNREPLDPPMEMDEPCTLLRSYSESGPDDDFAIPKRRQNRHSRSKDSDKTTNHDGADANISCLLEGSHLERRVICAGDPPDEGSRDAVTDTPVDSKQTESQVKRLNSVTNSPKHCFERQDHSPPATSHHLPTEDEGIVIQHDLCELNECSNNDLDMMSRPLLPRTNQECSRSTDANIATVQSSDPTLDQPLIKFHRANWPRSPSFLEDNSVSISKSTASRMIRRIDLEADSSTEHSSGTHGKDRYAVITGRSNASGEQGSGNYPLDDKVPEPILRLASSPSPSHNHRHTSEKLHRYDDSEKEDDGYGESTEGQIDDSDTTQPPVRLAPMLQRPESTTSYRPGYNVSKIERSRKSLSSRSNNRSRWVRTKWKGQQKTSSSNAIQTTATPVKRRHTFQNPIEHSPKKARYAKVDADSAPSSLTLPALSSVRETRACSDSNDLDRSFGNTRHSPPDITLRPVSPGVSFLVAIIRDDGAMPNLFCGQAATLVEKALSHAGKIDNITFKQLAPDSWLLSGFLHIFRGMSDCSTGPRSTKARGIYNSTAESGKRTLHGNAAKAVTVESGEAGSSSCEGEDSSDCDLELNGYDKQLSEDEECSSIRKHIPWSELDKQRLLAYKRENKSWEWIFRQFPRRTQGAVRTRWHMLQ